MFRYNNGQFKLPPPTSVILDGFKRKFADLTRAEWDRLGYNEAVPVSRDPFISYETQWVKGDDLIYREEIVGAMVDEVAKNEAKAEAIRFDRAHRLMVSDWTQLVDSTLDAEDMVLWQSYRQALRDIPQQPGFPMEVEWPQQPELG